MVATALSFPARAINVLLFQSIFSAAISAFRIMTSTQDHNSMRYLIRPLGILIALLLCLLLVTVVWHYRTALTNRFAKTHIEQILSTTLAATVTIGHLDFSLKHLEINGLSIKDDALYELAIPTLLVHFSLRKLLSAEIDQLHLLRPQLRLHLPDLSQTKKRTAKPWQPPVIAIDFLEVSEGQIDLIRNEWRLPIRALNLKMVQAPSGNAALSLEIGEDDSLALTATAQTHLGISPQLLLTTLTIDNISLLKSPLRLSPAGNGSVGGTINLDYLSREQLTTWLTIVGLDDPLPENMAFTIQDLQAAVVFTGNDLHSRIQAASIELKQQDKTIILQHLDFTLSRPQPHWRVAGKLKLTPDVSVTIDLLVDNKHVTAVVQGHILTVEKLPEIWGQKRTLPLQGSLDWAFDAVWEAGTIDLQGRAALNGATLRIGDTLTPPQRAQSSFRMSGTLAELGGEAEIALGDTPLLKVAGNLKEQTITLHQTELATLSNLVANSGLWPALIEPHGWISGTVMLADTGTSWHGHVDVHGDSWQVAGTDINELRFISPFLLQQQLELSQSTTTFQVAGKTFSAPLVHLESTLTLTPNSIKVDITSFQLKNLDYLAPDDMSALAGANLTVKGAVSLDLSRQRLQSNLNGSLLIQEALYGSFYGDLSELPINWKVAGSWQLETGQVQADEFHFVIADIGELRGSGRWLEETLQLAADLDLFELDQGYSSKLRPILAPQYPRLQQLDISGTLNASLEMTISAANRELSGLIRPGTISLRDPASQLELVDLTGEIPLFLSSSIILSPPVKHGHVRFARLNAGPAHFILRHLAISSTANRLVFVDPLEIQLGEGMILVDDLDIGLSMNDYYLEGKVRVDGISLEQLTRELSLTPLRGKMTADFGTVEYRNRRLRSDGDMRINIFAGEVFIRNLSATDIFSSYRSFAADIDLNGINLGQMTRTFEFGEINGTIDGYIHNLRLFGKTPSAFVAEISTREQGQRNISVKAINNLAVISQGGLSAALSRGVYRFIDFYRYRKIGIFCTLHNDVFVLKGTARSDSELYLVDGGLLPPRIDIVAPGTAISFREMLRRLERIDRSGTR